MRRSNGFTMIELSAVIVLAVVVIVLGVMQKNDLEAGQRDQTRKTAINALYYGITQGYFPSHHFYPSSISPKTLPYIDPKLFVDPEGRSLGQPASDYHYQGLNCTNGHCQKFELRSHLDKEATYVRTAST